MDIIPTIGTRRLSLAAALGLLLVACGGSSSSGDGGGDAAVEDASGTDVLPDGEDAAPVPDEGVEDAGKADSDGGDLDDFGFPRRKPETHILTCGGPMGGGDSPFEDTDYICKLAYDDLDAVVYSQGTPDYCKDFGGPEYTGEVWINVGGTVTKIEGGSYDFSGNHHNDSVSFTWEGTGYKLYHSSFGWGWRACAPPDCAVVSDGSGKVIEDGCAKDRSIPVTCKRVQPDGTIEDLSVDTFEPCPGDPNYR